MKNFMGISFSFLHKNFLGFYDVTIFYWLSNYLLITENLRKSKAEAPKDSIIQEIVDMVIF